MNIQTPQSYQSKIELEELASTGALIKSNQSSRLLLSMCQDFLTGAYLITRGEYREVLENGVYVKKFFDRVKIDVDTFNDICCSVKEWEISDIFERFDHVKNVLKLKNISEIYTGHTLLSLLFPKDFSYSFKDNRLVIIHGVIIEGFLTKDVLSHGPSSLIHKMEKEYGAQTAIDFISNFQFFINEYVRLYGFSIGLKDCVPVGKTDELIKQEISKSFIEANSFISTEPDPILREMKINNTLNNATQIGHVISKESMNFDNSLNIMILSGAKGNYINISQIVGLLGQQNVEGKRIPKTFGKRTLPHYSSVEISRGNDKKQLNKLFTSRGFISSSYLEGLSPQEFFFHHSGGREGLIDTSQKTASSGYIQRRIVKKLEDLRVSYQGTVINANNEVVQFSYGNGFNPARTVKIKGISTPMNIKNMVDKLNNSIEI
jgi:DNA-directed RNA polymerase II subunit RPB1